jgi:DNA-binding response OmpR family regulator
VSALTSDICGGRIDFGAFMSAHRPAVVVYDVALPYEANWRLFQRLRSTFACVSIPFVVTSTNVARLQQLVGSEQHVHEIVGKPYELHVIVGAVKDAARREA